MCHRLIHADAAELNTPKYSATESFVAFLASICQNVILVRP